MKALLIDIGSTFTKVTLVNLDPPFLIGTSQALTTAATDLMDGLEKALEAFSPEQLNGIKVKRACSSAAGGLRIVAIGLVSALTVKAAREAALGAGARILAAYSYTLTDQEIQEIKELKPDLLLLAGGTDGGEQKTILENAAIIAEAGLGVPVVYAGNKVAAKEAVEILKNKVPRVVVSRNVMPEVNILDPKPARQAIRQLYLEEITKAKGLDRIQEQVGLAMPTPMAVMRGGELLQSSWNKEVVVVDVGGATTDVHSFCDGKPRTSGVIFRGLEEPFAKRTVEGDLGMRVSIFSLLKSLGEESLAANLPFVPEEGEITAYAMRVHNERGALPRNEREMYLECALAMSCIREALLRHAGSLNETYTPGGRIWLQKGKDLTKVDLMVGTGGVLVRAQNPGDILGGALKDRDPLTLTPVNPELYLDEHYILSAIGLLAEVDSGAAQMLLKEALAPTGRDED